MKLGFYPRFAWSSIRKNHRLYTPYILTCAGMVMMYYIVSYLSAAAEVQQMPGGEILAFTMGLGAWIIAAFAVLFLLYTNAFLIRRRNREFGLYNILGMGKGNLSRILLWETGIIALISLTLGLMLGILLSKLFELVLVNLLHGQVSYRLSVSFPALRMTVVLFGCIFLLLLLRSLMRIHAAKPVELLRSESAGEKPPRANCLIALVGLLILIAGYYLALVTQSPLDALLLFFVAVLLVIVATYLLFISGSVALCRGLQKSKRYYYRANHFVSVSSMTYRMKRNGAGLASICILLTMVLVMISSTSCLYFGEESLLRYRYPQDLVVKVGADDRAGIADSEIAPLRARINAVLDEAGIQADGLSDYRSANIAGRLADGCFDYDASDAAAFSVHTYSTVLELHIVPLADYNRIMGTSETLKSNEALVYPMRMAYPFDTFQMAGGETYQVKRVLPEFVHSGEAAMIVVPSLYLIVPDFAAATMPYDGVTDELENAILNYAWYCGFDTDAQAHIQCALAESVRESLRVAFAEGETGAAFFSCEAIAENREEFFVTYGSLFALGILLSVVFLAAAVLIIYYKQISEGYEDQARFGIMRKVGMTQRDIRKSINSQMLTVFFLPLVMAGIHLCFAFPMIRQLLTLFSLTELKPLLISTLVSFVLFAGFYLIVYRVTSNAYYSIVSGAKEE